MIVRMIWISLIFLPHKSGAFQNVTRALFIMYPYEYAMGIIDCSEADRYIIYGYSIKKLEMYFDVMTDTKGFNTMLSNMPVCAFLRSSET